MKRRKRLDEGEARCILRQLLEGVSEGSCTAMKLYISRLLVQVEIYSNTQTATLIEMASTGGFRIDEPMYPRFDFEDTQQVNLSILPCQHHR